MADFATKVIREDVGKELAEYYSAAVFFNDHLKPEQPNNEIRNALNHIARAYDAADWAAAEKELAAADRHILRAKRDALKLAIIGLFDQIRVLLRNAEYYYGAIDPALLVRRAELVGRRRQAYASEASAHPGATDLLLGLFVDANRFLEDLENQFPSASPAKRVRIFFIRLRRQALTLGIGFILGVAASLSANFIWEQGKSLLAAPKAAAPTGT